MSEQISRRETLRRGLAATSLLALVSNWTVPGLAQGDTEVPFTDIPADFNPNNIDARNNLIYIEGLQKSIQEKK